MEVIYPKACGVDVHKSFIVAVICDSTSITPKYSRKRFSTYNNSLIQFRNWLIDNDCQNVCMYGIYRQVLCSRIQCIRKSYF